MLNIIDTPLVLKDIIKVGKAAKIKERKSKIDLVPENVRTENVTDNIVELAWDDVDKEDRVVSYQISSRKVGNDKFFRRNAAVMLKTKSLKFSVRDLEQDSEYEFRIRCEFRDGMGGWSKNVMVKTKISAPKNIKINRVTWDTISIYWDAVD